MTRICAQCGRQSEIGALDGSAFYCLDCVPSVFRSLHATAQAKAESAQRERIEQARLLGELAKARERVSALETALEGILIGIDDMPFQSSQGFQCIGCEGINYHEDGCAYVRGKALLGQSAEEDG